MTDKKHPTSLQIQVAMFIVDHKELFDNKVVQQAGGMLCNFLDSGETRHAFFTFVGETGEKSAPSTDAEKIAILIRVGIHPKIAPSLIRLPATCGGPEEHQASHPGSPIETPDRPDHQSESSGPGQDGRPPQKSGPDAPVPGT